MKASWLPRALALFIGAATAACGGYDPCNDKACGDPCQLCEEGDADCVEPAGQKVCNSNNVCTIAGPPICS